MRRIATVTLLAATVLGVPGFALAAHTWSKQATGTGVSAYGKAKSLSAPTYGAITCTRNGSSSNYTITINWTRADAVASSTKIVAVKNGVDQAIVTASPFTATQAAPGTVTYALKSVSNGTNTWKGPAATTKTFTLTSTPSCTVS